MLSLYLSLIETAEDEDKVIYLYNNYYSYMKYSAMQVMNENISNVEDVVHDAMISLIDHLNIIDFSDLKENEDLNGALLPLSLEGKYDFANVHFSDYGESQMISFDIIYDKNRIGCVEINTLYNGSFKGEDFNIGGFDVKLSQYDNVHQFEFVYDGNYYLVNSMDYDVLLEITESLE